MPKAARRAPIVSCETGVVTIEATLPPAVHAVRLRLSDGRRVTSPTVHIPARLSGPSALYYQVFKGEPSSAVSLTELGAHGRRLRSLRLRPGPPCERSAESSPSNVVASGRTPGGSHFTVRAERFGGFTRGTEIQLRADLGGHSSAFEELTEEGATSKLAAGPLTAALSTECLPPAQWLVYGLLKAPGDAVFAQTASGEVPLATAAIPARLHPGQASVVYGAFAAAPSGLVVRAPGGAAVAHADLAARATEEERVLRRLRRRLTTAQTAA